MRADMTGPTRAKDPPALPGKAVPSPAGILICLSTRLSSGPPSLAPSLTLSHCPFPYFSLKQSGCAAQAGLNW